VLFERRTEKRAQRVDDTQKRLTLILGIPCVKRGRQRPPPTLPAKSPYKVIRLLLIACPFTPGLGPEHAAQMVPLHWAMKPWLPLGLCRPVYIGGMSVLAKRLESLRNGVPNMNVLTSPWAPPPHFCKRLPAHAATGEA